MAETEVCISHNSIKRHSWQKQGLRKDFKQLVRNRKLNREGQVIQLISWEKVKNVFQKQRQKSVRSSRLLYPKRKAIHYTFRKRRRASTHCSKYKMGNTSFLLAPMLLHSQCTLTEVRLTGTYTFFFISIFCLEALSKILHIRRILEKHQEIRINKSTKWYMH